MSTANLTIEVSEEVANAFAKLSPEEQRKVELLLDLRLRELIFSRRGHQPLQAIMDKIGKNAATRGLTADELERLSGAE